MAMSCSYLYVYVEETKEIVEKFENYMKKIYRLNDAEWTTKQLRFSVKYHDKKIQIFAEMRLWTLRVKSSSCLNLV